MKNKGSRIASEIISDMRREEYFKKKYKRNVCIVDNKKQCTECKYQNFCDDMEVNNEV